MAELEQDSKNSEGSSRDKAMVPWRTCQNCGLSIYKDNPNYSQKWAGHSRNCPNLEAVPRSNRMAEARLRCSLCRSSFDTPEALDAHLQTHTAEKRVRKPPVSVERPEDDSPRAKRRKRAKTKNSKTDACQLIALGELIPLTDPRYVNFYAVKQRMGTQLFYLFPPGYEIRRQFKDSVYCCRILNNGDVPQFTVQEIEEGSPIGSLFTAPNPSQAVRECVGVNVSGPQFFGLTLPWIHGRILALPGAKQLSAAIRAKIEQSQGAQSVVVLEENEEDLEDEDGQTCPYCPATYSSAIGLRFHIDRKHPNGAADRKTAHGLEEEHCGICASRDYSFWTTCDQCERWFHQACVGISPPEREVRSFVCPRCKPRPASVSNAINELQRKVVQVEDDNRHVKAENEHIEAELYKSLRELKQERTYSSQLEQRLEEAAERLKLLQRELQLYRRTLGSLEEIPHSPDELTKVAKLKMAL